MEQEETQDNNLDLPNINVLENENNPREKQELINNTQAISKDISQESEKNVHVPEQKPKVIKKKTPKVVHSDDPEEDTEDEDDDDDDDDNDNENKDETKAKTSYTSEYDPANVHYEGDVAIYTDPKTRYQYQWCKETNEWKPRGGLTYGFEDDTHTYTDAEGVKYFWDKDKNAWFPKIDDDFMARYQMSYGFVDNSTDSKPTEEVKKELPKNVEKSKDAKRKAPPPEPAWFEVNDQQNTKVYVSNLPTDITEEEFVDFMQKCGLVMRDLTTGKMKVKLYTVPGTDILKGDALCTYIKIESVELALNVLDGYTYRGKKIQVERAKFEMKGAYNPSLKPKKRKKKEIEKLKKMQEKLFDWRPDKLRGERSKHERILIIKNLFEPSLFDKDVGLILEYQQDLREECSKCGDVRKVVLYDRHPEGVAQITMREPEEADACVALLNGRWFCKRLLSAEIWDGKTKFKIAETDAQLSKRLSEWDRFLETEEATKKNTNKENTSKDNSSEDIKTGTEKKETCPPLEKNEEKIKTSTDV